MNLAMVFPGQGSQSQGMLAELADRYPEVRATFGEAGDVLGYDLWALIQDDEDGRLAQTAVTQPALLTASVAIWRVWQGLGLPRPTVLAGHSLGEYSALVCADSLKFADAVRLVQTRGELMQDAVPAGTGAMAAILGLDDDIVIEACGAVGAGVVEAVNFNAPGQVVIAGDKAAVEQAIAGCSDAGARRALPLPVSVPSHCALMKPAAERLAQALQEITVVSPQIPVINNVDVESAESPDAIRDALVRQLYNPVRWVETMRTVGQRGVGAVVECGAGKVLGGLQKRIDRSLGVYASDTPAAIEAAVAALQEG